MRRGTSKFGNYSVKPKGVEATVAYSNHQLAVGSRGDLLSVDRLLIHRKFGGRRTVRVSCFKHGHGHGHIPSNKRGAASCAFP